MEQMILIKSRHKKPKFQYKLCQLSQLTFALITKSFKQSFQHCVDNSVVSTYVKCEKTLIFKDFSTFSTQFSTEKVFDILTVCNFYFTFFICIFTYCINSQFINNQEGI